MPRKKLPARKRKNHMLRILVSPPEFRAWAAEAKRTHDGVLSAFVRDRVALSMTSPSIAVSAPTADRIKASGKTADELINAMLDHEAHGRGVGIVTERSLGNGVVEITEGGR